jgi:hypothetical protein
VLRALTAGGKLSVGHRTTADCEDRVERYGNATVVF